MGFRGRQGSLWRKLATVIAVAGALFVGLSLFVEFRYAHRIRPLKELPEAPIALVFGAGLAKEGKPSPVLKQRMNAAIQLYRAGKVKKLLVSGDNTDRYHDETKAMRRYAIDRGVPTPDVIGDYAGVSTYDTCYRAREIFGVEKAILVTQDFHLPRAVFIANSLGIDAWGMPADATVRRVWKYELRELVARALTVPMVIVRPEARILGPRQSLDRDKSEADHRR